VDPVLFGLLAGGVLDYLREVQGRAAEPAGERVREDAGRLAVAWRVLLRQHELGGDGHCAACGRGRRWVRQGRQVEMCSVWQVAVAHFIRRPGGGR
jgi:hypothetical protein